MAKILYTRLSNRHNWDLLGTTSDEATKKQNFISFMNLWNSHINGCVKAEGWLNRHPKAQIAFCELEWNGGNLSLLDNIPASDRMDEVYNISDLVYKL